MGRSVSPSTLPSDGIAMIVRHGSPSLPPVMHARLPPSPTLSGADADADADVTVGAQARVR